MFLSLSALTSLGLGAIFGCYLSFKYPIKQDRYRHRFSERVVDRVLAYAMLLSSPARGENAVMPVASIRAIVREAADRYSVDPCLVAAVATFESSLNPNTITTTGAMGLMAIQPETAKILGIEDPFDSRQNVDGGARLLQELLAIFDADTRLALAAYNAGHITVRRYVGVPPYRETKDYVRDVGTIHELCRAEPVLYLGTGASTP
jgi:soluble lytic murein transglycosylase-like protein